MNNNIFKFFALFFTLASLPFTAAAQVMDTIAYVPVKQGYYDKISTKSKAQFAAETSSVSIKSLKANSATLNIVTTKASFGKPIVVKGNIFVRPTSTQPVIKAKAVEIQGEAYAGGVVVGTKAPLVKTVVARDVNLINRVVRLPSSSNLIIDGVSFPSPSGCSEGVEWRTVKAKNTADVLKDYTVVACKGTGSTATCTAPQADIDRCNNNANTWDTEDCCCRGTTELFFLDATMCEGSNIICNADKTITSATAVCNEFASDSAECVCAQGNLKQCVPKVYGGGSDEAGCVQSGEYHEACQCEHFIEFQSNYRNYACTGIPAMCEGGGGTTLSCPTASRPLSSQLCSPCGVKTRTVTCNTTTGTWTTGLWSICDTTGCSGVGACCCGSGVEINNSSGADCSTYNYTPKLQACVCAQEHCDADDAALCGDCGGTWNDSTCTCDCGFYSGNACTFVSGGGCKCGSLWRSCK